VRKHPTPFTLVSESADSWVLLKLVYYIEDYGGQYIIADRVLSAALARLEAEGIETAPPRIEIAKAERA
jgi:hypothetical protein